MKFKVNILVSTFLLSILSVFLTACDDDGRGTPATSKFESVEENQAVTQYQVNPSDLSITLNSGISRDEDLPAWQEIVKLLPDDILQQQVAEYQVFTDGQDNVLAFVTLYELDVSKWTLGVDYQDAQNPNSSQFATTVVHEFAHILSLETEQVERYVSICQNFQVNEGCAKEDSYLNSFYNQFWKGAFHEEHQSLIAGLTNEQQPYAIVASGLSLDGLV